MSFFSLYRTKSQNIILFQFMNSRLAALYIDNFVKFDFSLHNWRCKTYSDSNT